MYKSHDVNNPDYDTVKVTGVCIWAVSFSLSLSLTHTGVCIWTVCVCVTRWCMCVRVYDVVSDGVCVYVCMMWYQMVYVCTCV
jgi:hypothetical protein